MLPPTRLNVPGMLSVLVPDPDLPNSSTRTVDPPTGLACSSALKKPRSVNSLHDRVSRSGAPRRTQCGSSTSNIKADERVVLQESLKVFRVN